MYWQLSLLNLVEDVSLEQWKEAVQRLSSGQDEHLCFRALIGRRPPLEPAAVDAQPKKQVGSTDGDVGRKATDMPVIRMGMPAALARTLSGAEQNGYESQDGTEPAHPSGDSENGASPFNCTDTSPIRDNAGNGNVTDEEAMQAGPQPGSDGESDGVVHSNPGWWIPWVACFAPTPGKLGRSGKGHGKRQGKPLGGPANREIGNGACSVLSGWIDVQFYNFGGQQELMAIGEWAPLLPQRRQSSDSLSLSVGAQSTRLRTMRQCSGRRGGRSCWTRQAWGLWYWSARRGGC